jgi:hypothetical protein
VAEIDFITAFGRLLRDGKLRDAFAVNPRAVAGQIRLRESDLATWLQLNPIEVELQADVLLRKRLDLVKYFAPETCRRTGERLWQEFRKFGRENWPPESSEKITDAFQFCRRLMQTEPETLVQSEWNRLDFAVLNRRIALHWVRMSGAKKCRGIQLFLRTSNERWREFFFYFGL